MNDIVETFAVLCPLAMILSVFGSFFAFIRYINFREQLFLAQLEQQQGDFDE
jgi:hypothetical protein